MEPHEQTRRVSDDRLVRLERVTDDLRVSVAELSRDVQGHIGNQNQLMLMVQRTLDRHEHSINGHNSTPGLAMRIDRIEHGELSRSWHLRAVWVSILSLLAAVIARIFL